MRKIKMKTPHGYFLSQVRAGEKRKKMICTERKKNMQTHIHPIAEIERQRKSEQEIERQRKSKQEIELEIIIIKKRVKMTARYGI